MVAAVESRESAVDLYASLGWSFIPVDSATKAPLVFWKPFSERRPGLSDRELWGKRYGSAGIAVVTGAVSGLVVLDADGAEGVAEAERLGVPRTPSVRTPRGGAHYYFRAPPFLVRNGAKLGASRHLDVRGEVGYVVAPHTRKPDGRRYVWAQSPRAVGVADPPDWLLAMLQRQAPAEPPSRVTLSNCAEESVDALLDRIPDRVKEMIDTELPKGQRSEADFHVMIQLLLAGVAEDVIESIFATCPIGAKYREAGAHYLAWTLSRARQRVKVVRVRYADLQAYDRGSRLHLALVVEEAEDMGRIIRSGLTVPSSNDEAVATRWLHFWQAAGLPVPLGEAATARQLDALKGTQLRVEIDGNRTNPVASFHHY